MFGKAKKTNSDLWGGPIKPGEFHKHMGYKFACLLVDTELMPG